MINYYQSSITRTFTMSPGDDKMCNRNDYIKNIKNISWSLRLHFAKTNVFELKPHSDDLLLDPIEYVVTMDRNNWMKWRFYYFKANDLSHGRRKGGRGSWPPMDFENFSKKGCFLNFEG